MRVFSPSLLIHGVMCNFVFRSKFLESCPKPRLDEVGTKYKNVTLRVLKRVEMCHIAGHSKSSEKSPRWMLQEVTTTAHSSRSPGAHNVL